MIKKYRVPMLLFYYVIVMVLLSSLPVTANVMGNLAKGDMQKTAEYLMLFFCASHIILLILGCLGFQEEGKKKWKSFKRYWKKNVKYIVIGFFTIIVVNVIIGIFLKSQSSNQESLSMMQQNTKNSMLVCFYLVTVVIGPVNEELIFRRIILGEGQKHLPSQVALLLSSVLFGLIHIHSLGEMIFILPYLFTGLILGYVYYRSDNMITSSFLHIFNNLFGVILLTIAQ